jgi:hypothetical protein
MGDCHVNPQPIGRGYGGILHACSIPSQQNAISSPSEFRISNHFLGSPLLIFRESRFHDVTRRDLHQVTREKLATEERGWESLQASVGLLLFSQAAAFSTAGLILSLNQPHSYKLKVSFPPPLSSSLSSIFIISSPNYYHCVNEVSVLKTSLPCRLCAKACYNSSSTLEPTFILWTTHSRKAQDFCFSKVFFCISEPPKQSLESRLPAFAQENTTPSASGSSLFLSLPSNSRYPGHRQPGFRPVDSQWTLSGAFFCPSHGLGAKDSHGSCVVITIALDTSFAFESNDKCL